LVEGRADGAEEIVFAVFGGDDDGSGHGLWD
jgi:hypothetical protein